MDASDLIKSMRRQSCKEGAVHIWGPDADRRAKLLICLAVKGSLLGSDAILMTRWNAEHGIIESVQKDSFSKEGRTACLLLWPLLCNHVAKNRESDQ